MRAVLGWLSLERLDKLARSACAALQNVCMRRHRNPARGFALALFDLGEVAFRRISIRHAKGDPCEHRRVCRRCAIGLTQSEQSDLGVLKPSLFDRQFDLGKGWGGLCRAS